MQRRVYDSRPHKHAFLSRLKRDGRDPAAVVELVVPVKHYAIRAYGVPTADKAGYHLYSLRRDGKISNGWEIPVRASDVIESCAPSLLRDDADSDTNSDTNSADSAATTTDDGLGFVPTNNSSEVVDGYPEGSHNADMAAANTSPQQQTATPATGDFAVNTQALDSLTKNQLVAICKELGLRRDWCPVNKPEIISLLRARNAADVQAAARASGALTEAELATLTPSTATPEVAAATVPAAVPAAAGPDVTTVATLLAQLLASQKAGVDADGVRSIIEPMLGTQARDILGTVSGWVQETKDLIAAMPPREILVRSDRAEVKIDGLQHARFERLLRACSARKADGHRLNVFLYGPAGTGKTTAARNVAKALGLPFHCNGAISTEFKLSGFIDANGVCHSTEFRKAWANGGVYLFDEIDGSVSAAIVAFNAALANGVMSFPDGMIERHADCVVIAAGNTVNGATADFTGRSKLDAASLDRFVFIEWPIDDKVEEAMSAGRADWLRQVRRVRKACADKGIKVMITPRATEFGASLLEAGMDFDEVTEMVLRKGMNDAQWAMVA